MNKVVTEPNPAVAKDNSSQKIIKHEMMEDILKLITIPRCPKHLQTFIEALEPMRVTEVAHAEECNTND